MPPVIVSALATVSKACFQFKIKRTWCIKWLRQWSLDQPYPMSKLPLGKGVKKLNMDCRGYLAKPPVLRIEQYGFEPWPGSLHCVLMKDTLLLVPLSSQGQVNSGLA